MDWAVVAAIFCLFFLPVPSQQRASCPLLWSNRAAAGVSDSYMKAKWADKPVPLLWARDPFPQQLLAPPFIFLLPKAIPEVEHGLVTREWVFEATKRGISCPVATVKPVEIVTAEWRGSSLSFRRDLTFWGQVRLQVRLHSLHSLSACSLYLYCTQGSDQQLLFDTELLYRKVIKLVLHQIIIIGHFWNLTGLCDGFSCSSSFSVSLFWNASFFNAYECIRVFFWNAKVDAKQTFTI